MKYLRFIIWFFRLSTIFKMGCPCWSYFQKCTQPDPSGHHSPCLRALPPCYLGWGETWLPPSTPAEGQCTSTSAGCPPGARGRGRSSATFLWVQKTTSALGMLHSYSRLRHLVQVTLNVMFITIREPEWAARGCTQLSWRCFSTRFTLVFLCLP